MGRQRLSRGIVAVGIPSRAHGLVEYFKVFLEAGFALTSLDLPSEYQVHERAFNQDVAEEARDHAKDKVEG